MKLIVKISLILLFLGGCKIKGSDHGILERINLLSAHDPDRAGAMMDNVDYEKLSQADRHYFDFLSIKIQDKKFETHSSDSLLLDVLDYYSSHRAAPEYPEVLFYGGRVYADLDEYSKALIYFRQALRESEGSPDADLKSRTLSELSCLMQDLGQYDEAMDFAREAYELDSVSGDPLHIMYDLERMGSVSLFQKDYENSETFFRKAHALASKYSFKDSITHNLYLSAIKYHSGDIDSAKFIIRSVMAESGAEIKDLTLAYAAEIYRSASVPDTASLYAEELTGRINSDNKKIGYVVLLSDELVGAVDEDSIRQYSLNLSQASSDLLRNGARKIISLEDDKPVSVKSSIGDMKSSELTSSILIAVCGLILVIIFVCVYIFIVRYRKNGAMESESEASAESSPLEDDVRESEKNEEMTQPMVNADDLRNWILLEVSRKELKNMKSMDISVGILQSEPYKKITNYCTQRSSVADNSTIWMELEEMLSKNIPLFIPRLRILCHGNLKTDELRIAMLTRIGIRPSEISRLICKEPSVVSYRKQTIMEKMFGSDLDKSLFDAVIGMI